MLCTRVCAEYIVDEIWQRWPKKWLIGFVLALRLVCAGSVQYAEGRAQTRPDVEVLPKQFSTQPPTQETST